MLWASIIALTIIIFLVIVAQQPADYCVTREATIAAPQADVFAQVNDFHNWEAWSPWAKLDPEAKKTFEGAPSGIGTIFTWSGNKKIGEGRMTMTESKPTDLIRIKLDFIRPFPSTGIAEFTFKSAPQQTLVSWSMMGKRNFIFKAMCLFMNMDKMIGGDFEKGLAQMKAVVEGRL